MDDLTKLPDEFLPKIDELPGELATLARTIEAVAPGLGVRLTLVLESAFRGTAVYFHNVDNLRRKVRDQRIIERYNAGERVDDIARSVGKSSRHIWNILGREPGLEDERQLKLF
jgi:Mor family transcriptional regulator